MKTIQQIFSFLAFLLVLTGTYSCQSSGGEQTGSEFIPDMGHSLAYEANVYTNYDMNAWEEESVKSRRELVQPREPVSGTVPRGYSSVGVSDGVFTSAQEAVAYTMKRDKVNEGIVYEPNGSVPYYYPDTEEGRTLATQQLLYNPFPITQNGIARGQELYNYYCGICHGDKGDGVGYLVRDNGGKYPAQPANFLLDDLINSSNGRYYHSIIYGKNAMGAYADKLSYEERWQVIHYIRSLQAKEKKLKYSYEANTLNPEFGVPESSMAQMAVTQTEPSAETEEDHSGTDHGQDGGH
jgi:mono/diheme cytochrome c family protein